VSDGEGYAGSGCRWLRLLFLRRFVPVATTEELRKHYCRANHAGGQNQSLAETCRAWSLMRPRTARQGRGDYVEVGPDLENVRRQVCTEAFEPLSEEHRSRMRNRRSGRISRHKAGKLVEKCARAFRGVEGSLVAVREEVRPRMEIVREGPIDMD